jgi:hypothetical protein
LGVRIEFAVHALQHLAINIGPPPTLLALADEVIE